MAERRPEPRAFTPYQERSELIAFPVALFGGVLSYNDPQSPQWPVLYVESPEGQLSWHIDPHDLHGFQHVPVVQDYPWDKHSTELKYERIRKLVQKLPKMTYENPVYGNP